ncbi:nitroreductase family protein [Streptomyces sp. NPDC005784]|uniref:nitroreductase family protein n=1 Tax=Streptomyces sp. NPDC005784 TaxID=3364731 RepID=UPI00368C640E
MDVMTAVLSRRSEGQLSEPAPSTDEFAYLLRAAATAPDHGKLRPWRWILVHGEARDALGHAFADDLPDHALVVGELTDLPCTRVIT